MGIEKKYIFFRNDDVRDNLDESLVLLTNMFIKHGVPICHAVEPKNISQGVLEWLITTKEQFPDLIEIVQHGYNHNLNYSKEIGGKLKKGEFGGDRGYQEQFEEIQEGKNIMDRMFKDKWFPLFTFPYGARNKAALKGVSNSGFLAVNGSMGCSFKHRLFYFFGRLLNKEMLFGRKISYNLRYKRGLKLFQIDTAISVITKYIDEESKAKFLSLEQLKTKSMDYLRKGSTLGVVLHHRYHNSEEKIELLENYIVWLKSMESNHFVTQETIYNKFK